MNRHVLENLTLQDIPPIWIKKFRLQPGQYFTIRIISEEMPLITHQKISRRQDRIALMREIEKQLGQIGCEDSEEWIKSIAETRTFSEPKPVF